jgi:hypothetical protein
MIHFPALWIFCAKLWPLSSVDNRGEVEIANDPINYFANFACHRPKLEEVIYICEDC